MPWLRLDDTFDTHPKLLALTEQQRWRWTRVLLYCARYRTRGRITAEALLEVGVDSRLRGRLLGLGLLVVGEGTAVNVNDWAKYNPLDPTSAQRKERYRERHGNDEGTEEERPEERSSRAGTRARPVPNPLTPSPNPFPAEDDDLEQALRKIPLKGAALDQAREVLELDPARLTACVTAALTATKPAAYLAELIRNGSHPEPPAEPPSTLAAGATGTRSSRRRGEFVCKHCGLDFVAEARLVDHVELLHADAEPAPPPADLLDRLNGDDPEPDTDPEPTTRAHAAPDPEPAT